MILMRCMICPLCISEIRIVMCVRLPILFTMRVEMEVSICLYVAVLALVLHSLLVVGAVRHIVLVVQGPHCVRCDQNGRLWVETEGQNALALVIPIASLHGVIHCPIVEIHLMLEVP